MKNIRSYAKINLFLDVFGKSPNGYHLIETVFYELDDVFDELSFEEIDQGIEITCNNKEIPLDERNTVWQAAQLINPGDKGIRIKIKKDIPTFSGLGGGSSNAACTLKVLNQIWSCGFGANELMDMGKKIGMDVPFFILGGTAYAHHYGEELYFLKSKEDFRLDIKVIHNDLEISTKEAYKNLNLEKCGKDRRKSKNIIKGIRENNSDLIKENIHNDFEYSIFEKYPTLKKEGYHLSGSGSSLFCT